jgi:hypothetical protein
MFKLHRTVVDQQMIARELKFFPRFTNIGLSMQHLVAAAAIHKRRRETLALPRFENDGHFWTEFGIVGETEQGGFYAAS